jgi:hypothetical protein
MIRFVGLAAALAVPAAVLAQPLAPITTTPLLPPTAQPQAPLATQPPAAEQTPGTPRPAPQPVQMSWVPQGSALLQVLDKVNAQNAVLTVKVGQQAQFGTLSIVVQACDIHPADQPQDSAAYLTITDGRADAPGFRGWMLANNPSLSMLQHPIYDVRVVGCRA